MKKKELCDWSLRDKIDKTPANHQVMNPRRLFELVVHISTGLHALHSRNFVYKFLLFITGKNIFKIIKKITI